mgnify:CR=1 FL=1
MVVNYYEVKNCRYEIYDNCPVLFPPDYTEESLLYRKNYLIAIRVVSEYCLLSMLSDKFKTIGNGVLYVLVYGIA